MAVVQTSKSIGLAPTYYLPFATALESMSAHGIVE
jgi:hypothetical protein